VISATFLLILFILTKRKSFSTSRCWVLSTYNAHSETDCCGMERHTSYESIKVKWVDNCQSPRSESQQASHSTQVQSNLLLRSREWCMGTNL
jgi:hypothetical protein